VLLTGETGTGKSLIAGAIHANSPRREGTLVTVNCAALSETLLESELFGHEKGAFTGAHKTREGRFQQAHGGTLFLDEVAEMSPALQAKLLRAIEDQVIYRLGGGREIHVDVRILAATNRDLVREVEEGRFRKDLYYRLAVAPLHIPPLRERRPDVLPLAHRFLKRVAGELNRPVTSLGPEAEQALVAHSWPGNIRELRNVIERAALFSDRPEVAVADLGLYGAPTGGAGGLEDAAASGGAMLVSHTLNLAELEKQAIETALERVGWVQKEAAGLLGLSERQMTYRLDKLGITHPKFRTRSRRG
jgi:transcriptional regulator with GAF, ATPase, and Fis domain